MEQPENYILWNQCDNPECQYQQVMGYPLRTRKVTLGNVPKWAKVCRWCKEPMTLTDDAGVPVDPQPEVRERDVP